MSDNLFESARARYDSGDFAGASALCKQAIQEDSDFAPAHTLLGFCFLGASKVQLAEEAFGEAARLDPNNKNVQLNYGMSLKDMGAFEQARAAFERAIEIDTDFIPAYYNLTSVKRFEPGDPLTDKIVSMQESSASGNSNIPLLGFALGKIYDDIGEYDKAFENYTKANASLKFDYDHSQTLKAFDAAKAVFTSALINEKKATSTTNHHPIFIVGMPRSGSSLLEEQLARNPQFVGLGERPEIAQVCGTLQKAHPSHAPYPEIVANLSPQELIGLGDMYMKGIAEEAGSAAHIIDKNVLNFSLAGFIHLILPNATIIHSKRDAVDTCLSIYFQNFMHGHDYSFDLKSIANRFAAYADLMSHWDKVLGEAILPVQYEKLVVDKECELARVYNSIDFDPTGQKSAGKSTEHAIATASAWQARQPIYQSSINRWKNYETHLGPLLSALDDAGVDYA